MTLLDTLGAIVVCLFCIIIILILVGVMVCLLVGLWHLGKAVLDGSLIEWMTE